MTTPSSRHVCRERWRITSEHAASAAGVCTADTAEFCNRLALHRQCPARHTGRLFYYSKNAQRADAFKLLGGNYLVTPTTPGAANIGPARSAPHAFVCRTAGEAALTGRTARNTAPTAALNLDESAKHMAERRSVVTPTGPVSSRRPDSITEARLRSETMARGRC